MGNTEKNEANSAKGKSAKSPIFNKEVLGVVGNVVLWIFLIVAAAVTIMALSTTVKSSGVAAGQPNIFGYSFFSVSTDSMYPEIKSGDLVIVKKLDLAEIDKLQPDTIITYYADIMNENHEPEPDGKREYNTHRIVSVNEDGTFTTKGDNNEIADAYQVRSTDVVGTCASHISGGGSVMDFLRSQLGFLLCIVLPLIIFFIFKIYRLIVIIVARRNKELVEAQKQEVIEAYLAAQKAAAEGAGDNAPDEAVKK